MIPEIYFHVGLERTATTFLQTQVFPAMQGVDYIPKAEFRRAAERIAETNATKVLVSHEFDEQLEPEISAFTANFPAAHPIIAFRRQDSWMVSQYKRHIKKGHRTRFGDFIDLETDGGYYKKQSLWYFDKIRLLERYFQPEPLVLLFDELQEHPPIFLEQLADYVGCTYDQSRLDLRARHVSYSETQLRALWAVGGMLPLRPEPEDYASRWTFELLRFLGKGLRYATLKIARWLPVRWFDGARFVPDKEAQRIYAYFREDWQRVLQYVRRQRSG